VAEAIPQRIGRSRVERSGRGASASSISPTTDHFCSGRGAEALAGGQGRRSQVASALSDEDGGLGAESPEVCVIYDVGETALAAIDPGMNTWRGATLQALLSRTTARR